MPAMLVKSTPTPKVEFLCYDGEYPNLCSGELQIVVGDDLWVFPTHSLSSSGSTGFTKVKGNSESWIKTGPWTIIRWPEGFPGSDRLRREVEKQVNAYIKQGCCGGCL